MISAKVFAKQVEKFALDNAPVILTGVGVVGSVSAAYLTGKATLKAATLISSEKQRRYMMNETTLVEEPLSGKDTFKLVWMEYLPPAGVLTVTVVSIVCAQRMTTKRAAALAAAYSLSEKRFGEYKDKVAEKFNANKERQINDEIAQDHVTANPPKESQIIITGSGDVICYDLPTGRYFKSTMEKLRSVQNDINAQVNEIGHAALSDFYVALGLTTTPYSEELGWTTDKLFELKFSAVLTDENQPCISINYTAEPLRHGSPLRGCDDDPSF